MAAHIAHTITGLYYQEPAECSTAWTGPMEGVYSYENGFCVRVVTELAGVKLSIVRKQRPL